MKSNLSNLTFPTKLTITGLVGCAVAIWMQWLSGDPAYPKFLPGPSSSSPLRQSSRLVRAGADPPMGSLIALLVTSGWFARLPRHIQLLTHPGSIGHFAPGIFLGTLGMIVFLLLTDVADLVATVLNYRTRKDTTDTSKVVLRFFGAIFVLMGVVVIASGLHADRYHNLMHIVWGTLALGASFLAGGEAAKLIRISSGIFYLDAGGSRTDNRRFRHGKSVASWTDASAHRGPYFSSRAGHYLSEFRGPVRAERLSSEACMILDHACRCLHFTNLGLHAHYWPFPAISNGKRDLHQDSAFRLSGARQANSTRCARATAGQTAGRSLSPSEGDRSYAGEEDRVRVSFSSSEGTHCIVCKSSWGRLSVFGVVNVDEPPLPRFSAVDLSFDAVRGHGRSVCAHGRMKSPVELRSSRIAVHVDSDIACLKIASREHAAHDLLKHLHDCIEALLLAQRVDERAQTGQAVRLGHSKFQHQNGDDDGDDAVGKCL